MARYTPGAVRSPVRIIGSHIERSGKKAGSKDTHEGCRGSGGEADRSPRGYLEMHGRVRARPAITPLSRSPGRPVSSGRMRRSAGRRGVPQPPSIIPQYTI
ncbi:hypothetical protein EYF80_016513 [Liparis tanakae]|uniref:Uncharacterized protein n=1 Tax=Liparis tanakae TaxID=230148 RepID=A0A4Z2I6B7_9TELE|nr:hypothetical protein EYF80_016513 [Liparis tanakae]